MCAEFRIKVTPSENCLLLGSSKLSSSFHNKLEFGSGMTLIGNCEPSPVMNITFFIISPIITPGLLFKIFSLVDIFVDAFAKYKRAFNETEPVKVCLGRENSNIKEYSSSEKDISFSEGIIFLIFDCAEYHSIQNPILAS